MIDVEAIKARVDLREMIRRDLGKPNYSAAAYDAYPCPLHKEKKGQSLTVHRDGYWRCWGKCQTSGDVVSWLQRYHGMTFKDAIQALGGGQSEKLPAGPRQPPRHEPVPHEPPGEEWQFNALTVVEMAEKTLWSPQGKNALDYLMNKRGLVAPVIREARLGYIPGQYKEWKHLVPGWTKPDGRAVNVPCGITIPHFAAGNLWAVRVRRAAGDVKYQAIPGGSRALYWSDKVVPGWSILITEGEFDCLIAHQTALHICCTVSLASASNHHIDRRWHRALVAAPRILVRVDDDAAGAKAAAALRLVSDTIKPIQVPETKDINDYFLKHGGAAVGRWLKGEVAS